MRAGALVVGAVAAALAFTASAGRRLAPAPSTTSRRARTGPATRRRGAAFTDIKGNVGAAGGVVRRLDSTYPRSGSGSAASPRNDSGLEQIGTESDCQNGRAPYRAWYEILPAASIPRHDAGVCRRHDVRGGVGELRARHADDHGRHDGCDVQHAGDAGPARHLVGRVDRRGAVAVRPHVVPDAAARRLRDGRVQQLVGDVERPRGNDLRRRLDVDRHPAPRVLRIGRPVGVVDRRRELLGRMAGRERRARGAAAPPAARLPPEN